MRYSLFLGCTIPVRQMNYELSARVVSKTLGIDLVDGGFGCCGFPVQPVDEAKALSMAAVNLKKAAEKGLDVVTLCSACGEMLARSEKALNGDEATLKNVNKILGSRLGAEYRGEKPRVVHFARMLYQDLGVEKIKAKVTHPLKGLRLACHPGCHYERPSTLYDGFDDPEFPGSLDRLVEATGAEAVDYIGKNDCCGGSLLAVREEASKAMTKGKLDTLKAAGVDALVLICPFCGIMYDKYQRTLAEELQQSYDIPVLYYPQLLGLALGIGSDQLGFDINSVSVKGLLEKVGVKS